MKWSYVERDESFMILIYEKYDLPSTVHDGDWASDRAFKFKSYTTLN